MEVIYYHEHSSFVFLFCARLRAWILTFLTYSPTVWTPAYAGVTSLDLWALLPRRHSRETCPRESGERESMSFHTNSGSLCHGVWPSWPCAPCGNVETRGQGEPRPYMLRQAGSFVNPPRWLSTLSIYCVVIVRMIHSQPQLATRRQGDLGPVRQSLASSGERSFVRLADWHRPSARNNL
jgi:hypothetical protein